MVMIPEKYAKLGFKITKYGGGSSILRFNDKPIFIFNAISSIDIKFLMDICDTYLKISERKKNPACIKA
jgi:hypothetical protein